MAIPFPKGRTEARRSATVIDCTSPGLTYKLHSRNAKRSSGWSNNAKDAPIPISSRFFTSSLTYLLSLTCSIMVAMWVLRSPTSPTILSKRRRVSPTISAAATTGLVCTYRSSLSVQARSQGNQYSNLPPSSQPLTRAYYASGPRSPFLMPLIPIADHSHTATSR